MSGHFVKRHYVDVIEEFAKEKSISKADAWDLFFSMLSDEFFGWGKPLKINLKREMERQYSEDVEP